MNPTLIHAPGLPTSYPLVYPKPDSIFNIPTSGRRALLALSCVAIVSLIATFSLICWISYRFIFWKRYYRSFPGYNQNVLLIFNLLFADFVQSLAFSLNIWWVQEGKILAPSKKCSTQSYIINLGNIANGFFVLYIAIHTWYHVVTGKRIKLKWFACGCASIWIFCIFVTIIGPIMHPNKFFAAAGYWCWISTDFQNMRLWLHYLYIFICEFGTIAIYSYIFIFLRKQMNDLGATSTTAKVRRATKYMLVYPLVYCIATAPLAIGRMVAMSGINIDKIFFPIAAIFMTSCGWLDVLLYSVTRRVIVADELSDSKPRSYHEPKLPSARVAPFNSSWDVQTLAGPFARTVTITGGNDRGHSMPFASKERRRQAKIESGSSKESFERQRKQSASSEGGRPPTRSGHASTDSIFNTLADIHTETHFEVTVDRASSLGSSVDDIEMKGVVN